MSFLVVKAETLRWAVILFIDSLIYTINSLLASVVKWNSVQINPAKSWNLGYSTPHNRG
jgi:hypothetical protein